MLPTGLGPGSNHKPNKNPATIKAIPGYRNNHRGLYSRKKRNVRHPSRHVRRCGGRLRPSGESVVGTSVIRSRSSVAFTTISVANSMPVVRSPMRSYASLRNPLSPQ